MAHFDFDVFVIADFDQFLLQLFDFLSHVSIGLLKLLLESSNLLKYRFIMYLNFFIFNFFIFGVDYRL